MVLRRLLWISIISLFVSGCSPNQEPVKDLEVGIKETSDTKQLPKPSRLAIHSNAVDDASGMTPTILDKFCWEEDKEPCDITPNDPKELQDEQRWPFLVNPEEKLWFHYNNVTDDLPYPDEIALTQFSSKEPAGVEVEIIGDHDEEFQAPSKPGKYYYRVHMEWTKELIGEAYYAFHLVVRKEEK